MIMYIPTESLLCEVCKLLDHQNIKVSVYESTKAGIITGVATVVGGLLIGPTGLILGGVVSFVMASINQGKFRSVADIIKNDLSSDEKEKLAEALRNCLTIRNIVTLQALINNLQSDDALERILEVVVKEFFSKRGMNFT
ncbi:protein C19orf12 homolog isoform X2 [Orussus abietinus]|uniref:protein C19orf12 homolog isoform X2 n=1 Tax=Orussus abietinus TaxID=222816 RepID=UPI000626AF59|nr:protein C19orf12 homolog isoform X2 [Orussus abietinus]